RLHPQEPLDLHEVARDRGAREVVVGLLFDRGERQLHHLRLRAHRQLRRAARSAEEHAGESPEKYAFATSSRLVRFDAHVGHCSLSRSEGATWFLRRRVWTRRRHCGRRTATSDRAVSSCRTVSSGGTVTSRRTATWSAPNSRTLGASSSRVEVGRASVDSFASRRTSRAASFKLERP